MNLQLNANRTLSSLYASSSQPAVPAQLARPRSVLPRRLAQRRPFTAVGPMSKESAERLPNPPLSPSEPQQEEPGVSSSQAPPEANGSTNGGEGMPRWDQSITASMDYDFLWNRNPDCKFGESASQGCTHTQSRHV